MAYFDRNSHTLSGSHLVEEHSASGPVAAIDIRGPRRLSSTAARRAASENERRYAQPSMAADPYGQTHRAVEADPTPASVPSAAYSSGELPIAMVTQHPAMVAQQMQELQQMQQQPMALPAMTPEAYNAYVQAIHAVNQQAQLAAMQQAQMQQMQQLQMQMVSSHVSATQPAQARTSALAAIADGEDSMSSDGRVKFLLFGLALGALVVVLLSGNTWSNLRTRIAYAMMPTPVVAPAAPLAPAAAPPAAPVDSSLATKIPEYEVGRLPPAPPVAAPVAPAAPPAAAAAPRAAAPVTVAAAPKKQPMPQKIHLPVQPAAEEEPSTVNDPGPPALPGLDSALNMKAFGELGKAFKTAD